MTTPTDEEVERVARRLTQLEKRYRKDHEKDFGMIIAIHGIRWSRVGSEFVATIDNQPVITVPVDVALDPDLDGVVLQSTPSTVPEDWTHD